MLNEALLLVPDTLTGIEAPALSWPLAGERANPEPPGCDHVSDPLPVLVRVMPTPLNGCPQKLPSASDVGVTVRLPCGGGGAQLNETVALPPLDDMLTVVAVLVGPAWVTWSCCAPPGATDPLAGLRLAAPLDEVADQVSVCPPVLATVIVG